MFIAIHDGITPGGGGGGYYIYVQSGCGSNPWPAGNGGNGSIIIYFSHIDEITTKEYTTNEMTLLLSLAQEQYPRILRMTLLLCKAQEQYPRILRMTTGINNDSNIIFDFTIIVILPICLILIIALLIVYRKCICVWCCNKYIKYPKEYQIVYQ